MNLNSRHLIWREGRGNSHAQHGVVETSVGRVRNLREKIYIADDQLYAQFLKSINFLEIECWPCHIIDVKVLVHELVSAKV